MAISPSIDAGADRAESEASKHMGVHSPCARRCTADVTLVHVRRQLSRPGRTWDRSAGYVGYAHVVAHGLGAL